MGKGGFLEELTPQLRPAAQARPRGDGSREEKPQQMFLRRPQARWTPESSGAAVRGCGAWWAGAVLHGLQRVVGGLRGDGKLLGPNTGSGLTDSLGGSLWIPGGNTVRLMNVKFSLECSRLDSQRPCGLLECSTCRPCFSQPQGLQANAERVQRHYVHLGGKASVHREDESGAEGEVNPCFAPRFVPLSLKNR